MTPPSDRYHALADASSAPFPETVVAEVTRALAADGFVALPTETVYGLAARADSPAALRALAGAKGIADTRAWTWHVGSSAALDGIAGANQLVRRLVERYWPGPLTLVLQGVPPGLEAIASEDWIGIRQPAHEGTARLLSRLEFPVVMTSANPTGQAPLAAAAEIASAFPDVAYVVDAGPARLGEPSAVLRIGPGRFELLRDGLYDIEQLRGTAGRSIAFCCTGNTCRSPMAEGIARTRIAARLGLDPADLSAIAEFGFHVTSVGIAAGGGQPVASHAVEACAARGIDISTHTSRPATQALLTELDEVYGLTHSHVDALRQALPPQTAVRIELLDPEGRDIPDPFGGSREDYERCCDHIVAAIERRLADWI